MGPVPGACGCGGGMVVQWIPVPIQTRYRYSPALRHVEEFPTEQVVYEHVAETRSVPHRAAKYTKVTQRKLTKGKMVRNTK